MNPLQSFFEQQGFVVLDGALATELERHGANLDDPLWSAKYLLEAPELIYRVHMDYLLAGADVITSASYQASVPGFIARGMDRQAAEALLRSSVELALRARNDFWSVPAHRENRLKPLVAASIGPFGACLRDGSEYHGRYAASWAEVETFHRVRLDVLTMAGADLLAFETIPSLREAEILLDLLVSYPDQVAWLSFSCSDAVHLCHGETFRAGIELAEGYEQVVAAGLNCTAPQHVAALLRSVPEHTHPLLAYPNSGETWVASEHRWVGQGSGSLDPAAWCQAGARLIGGCCRTGPEDIARVRSSLLDIHR
ncbi:MAG TPA: homocysteine S-methyltransferase [Xanthomonadales bacterium]|nr:homocysteine S-methyltransferase [Xanthomonadales bacterium]